MSQGRAPEWANSTIFCRVESGSGRPLTYTPPSWFTPLWPFNEERFIGLVPIVIDFHAQSSKNRFPHFIVQPREAFTSSYYISFYYLGSILSSEMRFVAL